MSELILITGSISEVRDPLGKFDPSKLFYTFIEQDLDNENEVTIRTEPIPIAFSSKSFEIIQDLGSGKTLKAIDILSRKYYSGGFCYANLGLAWNPANEGKDKKEWVADLNSLENLTEYNNCTLLIDDIYGTILHWNTEPAKIVSLVANERRKMKKDLIITAQREVMIPPGLREMATEWIVPVITIRDFTKETPDNMGYPLEMRTIHFNGAKIFKYISSPLVDLEKLFAAYNTIEKSVHLEKDGEKPRTNQPGFALEVECINVLNKITKRKWAHFNGKEEFDSADEKNMIDITGTDPSGRLILEHKDLLKHMRVARRLGKTPWLMYLQAGEYRIVKITHHINNLIQNKRLDPDLFNNLVRKLDSLCV